MSEPLRAAMEERFRLERAFIQNVHDRIVALIQTLPVCDENTSPEIADFVTLSRAHYDDILGKLNNPAGIDNADALAVGADFSKIAREQGISRVVPPPPPPPPSLWNRTFGPLFSRPEVRQTTNNGKVGGRRKSRRRVWRTKN